MAHEVESMVSARHVPWHFDMTGEQVTTITDDVLTADKAITAAKLDWDVSLEKLLVQLDTQLIHVPDRYAVVRDRDHSILGTVGKRYEPVQNREAFEFMDTVVDSGEAKYETAGSLRGGKVIFLTMKVPSHMTLGDQEDPIDTYLVLTTSHDGSKAVTVYTTLIRVVCMNTLTFSLSAARHRWSVPHVSGFKAKVQEARETLKLGFKYTREFEQMANELLDFDVSDRAFKTVLEHTMPDRPKTQEVIDAIIERRGSTPTIADDVRGTAWGAFNAVTEYFDWGRPTARGGEAHFHNVMQGDAARARYRVGTYLSQMAV